MIAPVEAGVGSIIYRKDHQTQFQEALTSYQNLVKCFKEGKYVTQLQIDVKWETLQGWAEKANCKALLPPQKFKITGCNSLEPEDLDVQECVLF